jgi:hypothetical protein
MKKPLAGELARVNGLAFNRVVNRRKLVEGFHSLDERAREHPDYELLEKVYGWVFVPLSLWPIDVEGLLVQMLEDVAAGRELDGKLKLKCGMLQQAPGANVCGMVTEYEKSVREGSYEMLIQAQHKFDQIERELWGNPELKADWAAMKAQFDVDKYRNQSGVIRRRPVQERNFHPGDWKFGWKTEREQFQNVFDVFCHKYDLYGVQLERKIPTSNIQAPEKNPIANAKGEGEPRNTRNRQNFTGGNRGNGEGEDRPLLLKLTVNITAHGTLIMIPRYWSFDPRRDLKWSEIKRLHRLRSATKQGRKLSVNEIERRQEAEKARELWDEASAAGLKGDRRGQWVMGRLGWDPRTDESKLRRLLRF